MRRMTDPAKKSISELFSALTVAMINRHKYEPDFSYIDFIFHATSYRPATPDELAIWNELTHPRRHEELARYPLEREKLLGRPFVSAVKSYLLLYNTAMEESDRRIAQKTL